MSKHKKLDDIIVNNIIVNELIRLNSDNKFIKQTIEKECDKVKDIFINKLIGIEWGAKGIFPTEALVFFSLCNLFNVNVIIESGVRNGDSTEMWLKLYNCTVAVKAVDLFEHENDIKNTLNKLSKYTNFTFHKGRGEEVVPKIVDEIGGGDKSIGIFLDGPKGEEALQISQHVFSNKNVKFIAIHDMGYYAFKYNKRDKYRMSILKLQTMSNFVFSSDEKWFYDKYWNINSTIDNPDKNKVFKKYLDKYPIGCGMVVLVNPMYLNMFYK